MKLAIQTLLLPGDTLTEKFERAAQAGFDGVEVAVGPDFDLRERLTDIEAAVRASGLPVGAICTHPIHDPLVPDEAPRRARFRALGELLQLADSLQAAGVVSVPVRPPHTFPAVEAAWERRFEILSQDAEAAFQQFEMLAGDAKLFLEPLNRYEAYFLNRVDQAVTLCKRLDHPRIRALGDLFHMNIEEARLDAPLREAGDYLGHVHIADNNRFQPGAGCLDFETPFAALKAMGYDGWLSVECWSADGPRLLGDPEQVLPETVQFVRGIWDRL